MRRRTRDDSSDERGGEGAHVALSLDEADCLRGELTRASCGTGIINILNLHPGEPDWNPIRARSLSRESGLCDFACLDRNRAG